MSRTTLLIGLIALLAVSAYAQSAQPPQQPGVRVNYLNVCTPSATDTAEISSALSTIPARASFGVDYEVARGRSTMADQPLPLNNASVVTGSPVSNWVRVRREFTSATAFSNVQYSFSSDDSGMTETLVFRAREGAKGDVLQISLQDTVTSGTPAAVVSSNTPVNRVRIERSGKSSLVVARCADADQSSIEPLFRKASELMAAYRTALDVRRTVPADLARLNANGTSAKTTKKAAKPR